MAGYELFAPPIPAVEADFIALDFETANRTWASPCAIGLAFVKNGTIVANPSWLIRPPKISFDADFIKIHGITPEAVSDKPEFPEVWNELEDKLAGRLIIAHNAEFDLNVLRHSLKHYHIAPPSLNYACTLQFAQRVWPTWGKYGLAALAARHGIVFEHHDAGEDAAVCAQLAIKAMQEHQVKSLDELATAVNLTHGRLHSRGLDPVAVLRPPEQWLFGNWRPAIHDRADQMIRRKRAETISEAVLNPDTSSGIINGYEVTLDSCTCADFQARKLPCKHIYHLAAALK